MDRFVTSARVTLEMIDHLEVTERQFSCAIRLSVPGRNLFAQDWGERSLLGHGPCHQKIEQQLRKRHNKTKARKHTLGSRQQAIRQSADM